MRNCLQVLSLGCPLALAAVGCTPSTPVPPANGATHSEIEDVHDHPSEGPHHGALIELGDEQYHAEIVHDEQTGELVVYMLDGAATNAVAIDATDVSLNLTHDGKPEQFKLSAHPDVTDPAGSASRFTSSDAELLEDIEHGRGNGHLVVRINGQQFRGSLHAREHDEDHE